MPLRKVIVSPANPPENKQRRFSLTAKTNLFSLLKSWNETSLPSLMVRFMKASKCKTATPRSKLGIAPKDVSGFVDHLRWSKIWRNHNSYLHKLFFFCAKCITIGNNLKGWLSYQKDLFVASKSQELKKSSLRTLLHAVDQKQGSLVEWQVFFLSQSQHPSRRVSDK